MIIIRRVDHDAGWAARAMTSRLVIKAGGTADVRRERLGEPVG
jgi:hypothetical protein